MFTHWMLSDNGPVKVGVYIGAGIILLDLTENRMLIAQTGTHRSGRKIISQGMGKFSEC